jgi:hypothetical protein
LPHQDAIVIPTLGEDDTPFLIDIVFRNKEAIIKIAKRKECPIDDFGFIVGGLIS